MPTDERLDRVITIGTKFRGKTLREVLNSKEGVDYVRYMRDTARSPTWRLRFADALKAAKL